ncbi:MFS transporter [Gordonia sp. CPCC 206044]|uniref:MFS transporter n=1 Tax=Gordonia sp. CPCC 206044 TaxID=3140793 RepID=UPI003AF3D957
MQPDHELTSDQRDDNRLGTDMNRLLTAGLCAGYFLVLLDVTVVNVALPQLDTHFRAGGGLAWVVDAYTVPLAALLLAVGAVGDRIGHRGIVLAGFTGFGAASAVCAVAPTLGVLVAGRVLQGTAAALMLPGTLALLMRAAPDERARTRAVGLWAAVGGAALPAGPVVGGLLVQIGGWRSVFWIGVPVIVVALTTVLMSRSPALDPPSSPTLVRAELSSVDWPGAALLAISLGCAVTALIQGTDNTALAVALVAAAALTSCTLWWLERHSSEPLLRVAAVARRPLALACGVAAVMNLCVQGALFVLTRAFQTVHGLSPLAAGLVMLPAMAPLPLLGAPSARLITRIGHWRTSALGLLIAAIGFVWVSLSLSSASSSPNHPMLVCSLLVWGCGIGVLTPGIVSSAMHAVPESPGMAAGAGNTSRQAGGAIGVALFGAIAGTQADTSFTQHVGALLCAGAVAFLLAALTCVLLPGHASSRRA